MKSLISPVCVGPGSEPVLPEAAPDVPEALPELGDEVLGGCPRHLPPALHGGVRLVRLKARQDVVV